MLLFVVTNIIYAFMLGVTIPKVMSFSGGMKIIDMMPAGYNSEYVRTLLTALGEKGRATYLYNQIPVDMIYPLLFAVSYCLTLAYVIDKLGESDGPLFYVSFLPILAGTFDYCENIGIIRMLNDFPKLSESLVSSTSLFSVAKSTCTTIYFIILIFSLILLGFKKLKSD